MDKADIKRFVEDSLRGWGTEVDPMTGRESQRKQVTVRWHNHPKTRLRWPKGKR